MSFTDLFIGILFLFLILVAALMLMHQEAIQRARREIEMRREQVRLLQEQLDALNKLEVNHPPFRLAMAFNSYQRPAIPGAEWKFSRTVALYRSPNGLCLEYVLLRNNLNLGWKPPVTEGDIPTADNAPTGVPCTLSASKEHWDLPTEAGDMVRVSANLYSGFTVLHTREGDQMTDLEYRILGVYDGYYRAPAVFGRPPARPSTEPAPGRGTVDLN